MLKSSPKAAIVPRVSYRGGDGGDLSPSWFWQGGDIPPIKLQNSVFLMGILVKSFKKVFRRQIPFFLANLCFLIVPPPRINFFLVETLVPPVFSTSEVGCSGNWKQNFHVTSMLSHQLSERGGGAQTNLAWPWMAEFAAFQWWLLSLFWFLFSAHTPTPTPNPHQNRTALHTHSTLCVVWVCPAPHSTSHYKTIKSAFGAQGQEW